MLCEQVKNRIACRLYYTTISSNISLGGTDAGAPKKEREKREGGEEDKKERKEKKEKGIKSE